MKRITHTRPATPLIIDDRTDHKRLYNTIDTAVPPLPTDTGHDEVFLKSLELAVEELQLRLCEAHLDTVQQHPISLWVLRTCLELVRDEYLLCIHRDGAGPPVHVQSSPTGEFSTFTTDTPDTEPVSWDDPSSDTRIRDLLRTHPVSFVHTSNAP